MSKEHFFLELEPPQDSLRKSPHVVIVGGGFAGIHVCKALAKSNVRISLIDKRNFNLFQPFLYQVSTGLVSRGDVATPLRELVGTQKNVQVLLGEVTSINVANKYIVFSSKAYSYDYLILASGSGSTFFGQEQWRAFAPPMKILEHAEEIRRRLLMAMEQAEQTNNIDARQFLQTIVIVGAGPSGCEMAGAVSELTKWAMRNAFKQLDPQKTRILLVDPGERVLRSMDKDLGNKALKALENDGVEFMANSRVKKMSPGEVTVETPDGYVHINAATVIWTAGVRASSLGKKLAAATECEIDRNGRVIVESDFSIPGYKEIRVAGDLCNYNHTSIGKPLPGMAAPAKQAGTFIGNDIAAILEKRPRPTFNYIDFGSMAVLDRATAVADLRGLKFVGRIGWILWALTHLVLIPGWENRISLSIKWIFALITQQRASMLLTGMPSQHIDLDAPDAHFPMQTGQGPSIASPDAALKAAIDLYSYRLSGISQNQEFLNPNEDTEAESAAAIR